MEYLSLVFLLTPLFLIFGWIETKVGHKIGILLSLIGGIGLLVCFVLIVIAISTVE